MEQCGGGNAYGRDASEGKTSAHGAILTDRSRPDMKPETIKLRA
jgi:hypothetical protein